VTRLRRNLVPPSGLPRLYAFLSLLLGIGRGAFLTGSAVYFLKMVGLQPWQIGVGFSAAAGAAVVTAVPLSRLADKQSPRHAWLWGLALEAALFAMYPWAHGFWAFLALVVGLELANTLNYAGRNVYTMEMLDPETRVITQAFARSWLNVGWGLGALIAGGALVYDTPTAYNAMVYINVTVIVINAVLVFRLDDPQRQVHERAKTRSRTVWRDHPYVTVNALIAVLLIHGTISLEVVPLWMIVHTDAPRWMLAVLTLTNTLMATTLQVAMTRGSHTIAGGRRVMRLAGWIGAACCPIFWLTGTTAAWVTVALLVLATILVTMSELWQSAAAWTLMAELAPPDRRGEYSGMARLLGSAQGMIAPAALIALAVTTGGWGWLVIAGLFLGAATAAGPAVDWAARTRHFGPAAAPADPIIRAEGAEGGVIAVS
jgi:MFS family permease